MNQEEFDLECWKLNKIIRILFGSKAYFKIEITEFTYELRLFNCKDVWPQFFHENKEDSIKSLRNFLIGILKRRDIIENIDNQIIKCELKLKELNDRKLQVKNLLLLI